MKLNYQKELNIGTLHKGVEKIVHIPIKNTSDKKLEIFARTSCGCSAPTPNRFILEQGQEQSIEVKITKTTPTESGFVNLTYTIEKEDDINVLPISPLDKTKLTFNVV